MTTAPSDHATDVLVIGGGNAGISLAARLRRKGITDIVIAEPKSTHHFRPMLSYVGAGLKTVPQMSRAQHRVMPRGVRWIQDRVQALDPAARSVPRSRHWRVRAESPTSAMFSHGPCLGVSWISRRPAKARAEG